MKEKKATIMGKVRPDLLVSPHIVGELIHLVLVCGAKWKRPVKLVYGIGRKGNGAICAPNRQNESSPIGSIGLWRGFYFAPQTSTSLRCEMGHVEPLERPMTREGKVTV